MIDKESFCNLLEDCRNIESYIDSLSNVNIQLNDDHPCYKRVSHVIEFLDKQFNSDSDWVSYYFYERNCDGMTMRGEPTPLLWDEHERCIWIHSDAELYDYLSEKYSEG